MAGYTSYAPSRLLADPTLEPQVARLMSCMLERDLFRLSLLESLTFPNLIAVQPRDYDTRLASLPLLLEPGQEILKRVDRYQQQANTLTSMLIDGPLYDAAGERVQISDRTYLQDFMAGMAELRDCFAYTIISFIETRPEEGWAKFHQGPAAGAAESPEDALLRGMNMAEGVTLELVELKENTLKKRQAPGLEGS